MSATAAAALALASLAAGWAILRWTAARRRIPIGRLPVWLAVVVPATAAFGARLGPLGSSACIALGAIAAAAVGDARSGLLFDALVAPSLIVLLVAGASDGRLVSAALGAAAASAALAALYLATARRGIGLGDVKLAAVLGAGIGPLPALLALGAAFVLGACWGLTLLARGRAHRSSALPFGPFVAAGGALVILSGGAA